LCIEQLKINTLKRNIICSIFAATLLFSGCSTDLDVIGDYKETIIVYGLLDQAQPKQYIKINKAFLGEGNAFQYAQIKDSTQFVNSLTVELRRFKNGAQLGATIVLSPDGSIPKDPGTFYAPDQANAIYSTTNPLFVDSEYYLTVRNNESGTEVTAKTELITDISPGFIYPAPGGASATFSFAISGTYPHYPFPISWTSAKNARLYQPVLRLNYIDSTASGNDTAYLDYQLQTIRTLHTTGGLTISSNIEGRDFMRFIGSKLDGNKPGLIKRRALKVDLMLLAGADELSTFIDVNVPSTGIIQERPEYTNVKNGLGLFSARLNRAPLSRNMDNSSLDSLACGQYTRHLKFVDHLGLHPCL
jgi:hypothetical protein